jgi:uncharacterized membrane protein HdeD (DUF308 family)
MSTATPLSTPFPRSLPGYREKAPSSTICSISMLAFWTAGQFFIEKAYVLLVFAGIWALMQGITDIVRAFAVRGMHEELTPSDR